MKRTGDEQAKNDNLTVEELSINFNFDDLVFFNGQPKIEISGESGILKNAGFEEINSTTDHEGRVFPTISAMCEFWKIAVNTYRARVKYLGWSKERALTSQKDQRYARNRKKS